ncbi:MAG: LamG domain-containing protein, partial [Planctomycetota bacterium]
VGQFGQALAFENNRVGIPASDSLTAELFQGSFTLSAWINPKRTGDTWQQIFRSIRADDTSNDTLFLNNDGRLSWRGRVGAAWAGGMCETAPGVVPADQWTHVAVTGDGTNFRIYVNGALSQESAFQITDGTNATYYIGGDPQWTDESYSGVIDDVRLYDHAMSAEDIAASMESQGGAIAKAYGADPADGTLLEATWVTLGWRAGDFAVSHDVYLGDNFDDVNDGLGDSFIGNQAATMLIAGFPGFPFPDRLVPGTTYYWRIDEVNDANAASPWKGDVWSFSIQPYTAYNPDPPDGTEFVALDATFSWMGGFGAKLHTVYIGTSFDEVNDATGGAPQGTTTLTPGALESEKVYYWRVDEFDAFETYKGDVWSFTTPGAVGNPQPANGAVDVQMIATLSWMPADNAASHEVYFGTDKDAVNNATTASPEYIGPKALGAESYDPGGLAWDSSYAWRVDEVYPAETIKGLVWSFTTADFILVDDFESYNDIDPPDEASNRIFDKWIDGFGTTTNGALVGNDLPPYAEQTIVHGGAQSMPYFYDNANKTSEATLTLVYPRDWTEEGVTKLSLWFRGASANAADRMYVALNGGAPVYHDDPAVTQTGSWTEWVIDLAAFGVDLTNVNTITIGFSTKGSPAADGGTGTMYFDDIRLIR